MAVSQAALVTASFTHQQRALSPCASCRCVCCVIVCVMSRGSSLLLFLHPSYFDPFLYFHTLCHLVGEGSQPLSLQMLQVRELKSQKTSCLCISCRPRVQEVCFLSHDTLVAGTAEEMPCPCPLF